MSIQEFLVLTSSAITTNLYTTIPTKDFLNLAEKRFFLPTDTNTALNYRLSALYLRQKNAAPISVYSGTRTADILIWATYVL